MKIINKYFTNENNINILDLTEELNIFYLLNKFQQQDESLLIVTNSLYEASNYYSRLLTHLDDVYLFPMDDFLASVVIATSPELKLKRLETLNMINTKKKMIVVTNLTGYLRYLPDLNKVEHFKAELKVGQTIDRKILEELFDKFGYVRESIVSSTGEYAIRGYIVDLFLPLHEDAIRIEFFGDEIEEIRYFDVDTQLSLKKLNSIELVPVTEIITKKYSSLLDYLKEPVVTYINFELIEQGNLKLEEDIFEYNLDQNLNDKYMFEFKEINPSNEIFINTFSDNIYSNNNYLKLNCKNLVEFDITTLNKVVKNYIKDNKTVIICLNKKDSLKRIKEILPEAILSSEDNILNNKINIIIKKINKGFELENYVFISEYDIDSPRVRKIEYKNIYKVGRKIKKHTDLVIGDYVVHRVYGIGIYNGLVTLTRNDMKKDYIQIIYKDNDKIYVPVEKINTIYKYSSKEGMKPRINKLGTTTWQKTKDSFRNRIKDISIDLLDLYAKRSQIKRHPYIELEEEAMFEADFIYDETADQTKAINEIKKDLLSSTPMDRLLCGDVGFGKTEVAFRAMFKTIVNGFQVSYLCPTTILSKQQYISAKERFEKFGVNISLLNRFVTSKEVKKIKKDLINGKIDLIFGTHRLLSDDIKFKKLGLLVIDEEQRFGVTHKEKIKDLKNDINVLTLSATPIPRTMKLALSGLRDFSIIDTPPVNRYPIQTYVLVENDLIVKDAIYKELSRNGQVFILFNNVSKIENQLYKLKKLVPEAKINYAHGQMNKTELENIMQDFIDHKFDVLLCTTIIETGIDITNTNTLIIYDADRFGLSQLYQIRGRVGRGDKIAYAYLMYKADKILNEIAVKRLQAIKEFTELGSGYRIAMRDLSIRGAGDLLGGEQAGFIDSVGIDLYTKMIDEEIKKLKGEELYDEEEEENSLLQVDTHIRDKYVDDEKLKIEIHKKINEIKDLKTLNDVKNEIEDRFGKIDEVLEIYMYEEWFEKIASKLGIKNIKQTNEFVEIEFPKKLSEETKGDKLLLLSNQMTQNFTIRYRNQKIYIKLKLKGLEKHFIYYLIELLNKLFPGK